MKHARTLESFSQSITNIHAPLTVSNDGLIDRVYVNVRREYMSTRTNDKNYH